MTTRMMDHLLYRVSLTSHVRRFAVQNDVVGLNVGDVVENVGVIVASVEPGRRHGCGNVGEEEGAQHDGQGNLFHLGIVFAS